MTRGRWPIGLSLVSGFASAALGLLPWLISGMRLPLQNLWAVEATPETMPRALLPFSQYELTLTAGLLVTGGAAAGLVVRLGRRHGSGPSRVAVLFALALSQLVTVVHSAVVVHEGLEESRRATLYLSVLVVAAALSTLTSLLVACLITARARGAAVVGMAIAAVLVGPWLSGFAYPPGATPGADPAPWTTMLPWVSPVLVGAAIAWGGLDTVGRIAAALVALAALWIGPAAITAISNAAGTRVLAARPAEMAQYAAAVFAAALTQPVLVLRSQAIAVVVAVLGLLVRYVRGRVVSSREVPAELS